MLLPYIILNFDACFYQFFFWVVALLLALVQLKVSANKAENLTRAKALVTKAAENGAKVVSLPVSSKKFPSTYFHCSLTSVISLCVNYSNLLPNP